MEYLHGFMQFLCAVTDFEWFNAILLFNHYFNDIPW